MKLRTMRSNSTVFLSLICVVFLLTTLFLGLLISSRNASAQASSQNPQVIYDTDASTHLFALSASDGKLLWKQTFEAGLHSGPSVLVDQQLFVPTDDGTIFALRADDGQLLWKVANADTQSLAGLTFDKQTGLLLAANLSCHIMGFDIVTREFRWNTLMPDCVPFNQLSSKRASSSSVRGLGVLNEEQETAGESSSQELDQSTAMSDDESTDILYLTAQGTGVFALRTDDGSILWHRELALTSPFQEKEGKIYTATAQGVIILDAANGQTLQTLPLPSDFQTMVALSGQTLYVLEQKELDNQGHGEYHLLAYGLSDSQLLWQKQLDIPYVGAWMNASGGSLYFTYSLVLARDNQVTAVFAYDDNGTFLWNWHNAVGEGIDFARLLYGNVYFSTFLGAYTLQPKTGEMEWHVVWQSLAAQ